MAKKKKTVKKRPAKKKALKKKSVKIKKKVGAKIKKKVAKKKISKAKTKSKKAPAKKASSKKKIEQMARLLLPLGKIKEIFRTRYGFFLYDGSEFVINNPETPVPWCNTLTNGDYGMIISQSGCGVSFKAGLSNKITRWHQDLISGNYGKFIYLRDNKTQDFWSATWKPVCKKPDFYEVRHGIGYTNISSSNNGIITSLIYYVGADEPVEVWQMRIINNTDEERSLSVFSYTEWDFGIPSGVREYDKLFVDTSFDEGLSTIFAKNPNSEWAFHSVNHKVSTYTCGRDFFLGAYRDPSNPRCVEKGMCFGEEGRYNDPAASLHLEIELPPRGEKELFFTVGMTTEKKDAETLIKKYKNVKVAEEEFSRTGHRWGIRLNNFQITTPDEGANIMTNKWFRYQAMSAGLSSFGSLFSPKGLVNLKDFLINGLTLLSVHPKYMRKLLLDAAEKEFEDGSMVEEWDAKTQVGSKSDSLEVPLWLIYALCQYLKETKDLPILDEEIKYQDTTKESLFNHAVKIIDRVFESLGKKGIPPLGGGDYFKKLEDASIDGKGESIWLGQFLIYIVSEFIKVCSFKKHKDLCADYELRLKKLQEKVKKVGWHEDRFIRAISHTGREIGTSKGKNAKLFLDTQAWGIISGLCQDEEATDLMNRVKQQLYKEHGPIMVAPAYDEYKDDVGTLSKLPPGVMENGGIVIEAACWAIWAETMLGRANNAWSIYTKLNPVDRSHKSDIYKMEPFVSCEYVDGPDAPTNGFARYSWFNRSGYWMFKMMTEEILGIKPTYEGLRISPCIPNRWRLFKVRRNFRNAYYNIEVLNPRYVSTGIAEVIVDGKKQKSNLIPDFGDEKRHHVKVIMGNPR
ncbi:GH36-type glycosyl hydrolase domain-containing protein [Candidatus Omnitrophota bacterium]